MGGVEQGPPARGRTLFELGGDVGRDLAEVDWDATPLGPPSEWPQSLVTAVSMALSSRFPMWLAWGPDLTFFCNAAYRRDTLGRKYPWALGRPAREVWAEIWGDIGPRIDGVLATGTATWDQALLLFLERSGYREETYHTFSYSPLRDDFGAAAGMLCVVSEETDRIIGERRMATLRDLGSDPSSVRTEQEMLTFAGRQLSRNQQDLPFTLTYLFEDGIGARLAAASGIPTDHRAAPAELRFGDPAAIWPIDPLVRGESVLLDIDPSLVAELPPGTWSQSPTQALLVPLLRQGSTAYGALVVGLNPYRPLDAGYQGFIDLTAAQLASGIGSARDYQAQQRRAEELAELDRAKTAFFSNVSHEFRTPLTLIMGPVGELQNRLDKADDDVRADLEIIHRNGLRLGKLVNTLLDFSRIEAGRMQARYEPVDLAAVTAELASVFRSAIEKAGLAFIVDCPPLPESVYIDRDMWEKVVLNLLSNALKFTFDGAIDVTVRADGSDAVVTVTDTGIGVAPSEMPQLFERFHRIENARSRSNEGSGIGLALVKELVGLHGGSIVADSEVGGGTTFAIRLPFGSAHLPGDALAPAERTTTVSATADPFVQEALRWLPADVSPIDANRPGTDVAGLGGWQTQPTDRSARILVADDNADMRDYLARLLGAAGHRVQTVNDGQDALEAAHAALPDLIISDVMMPRLDGLRLVAALREDPRTAGTPVLLLSARAGEEASIEGLDAGADDYLVKPFSAAELLARVRANVELARLRNHHARWRTALVDSLQEAFFVCDEAGTVVETNAAFTDILGYGPDQLPYPAPHPWWPAPEADPGEHGLAAEAFEAILTRSHGTYTVPVNHRDGRRIWIAVAFNQVEDPDNGRRMTVGTFRDVTAEHYAVQRDGALAALSLRLSQAGDLSEALAGALDELRRLWQAAFVVAAIFDGVDAPTGTVTSPEIAWADLPEERRGAVRGLRDKPLLAPIVDQEAGVGIALEHPHGTMVIWIQLGDRRPANDYDGTLLALLAGHLSQALHRIHQNDQQRETALALQHAILGPAHLPSGFAVRYQPASHPLEVGGDWYDTVPRPDGRIGIVVGDCVGHGLQAATVMGQLRSACRALLLQDASAAQTLMALDRFATLLPGAACASVFCGLLDPVTGELQYSSAGHPPAILALPNGTTELLDQGRSVVLGVRPDVARPEAYHVVPPRATLLLYTDGLVEQRRQPLTRGIDHAAAALADGTGAYLEDAATDIMRELTPAGGYEDDVALLVYRHPSPLELELPAEASSLAPARGALRAWLNRVGLQSLLAQDILVAAGEAYANAIEHSHPQSVPGVRVRLWAAATAEHVYLTISDTGTWKSTPAPVDAHRGRGLALMQALMHHVSVTRAITGTTVDMYTRITP